MEPEYINEECNSGVCYKTCKDPSAKGLPAQEYSAAEVIQAAKLALKRLTRK